MSGKNNNTSEFEKYPSKIPIYDKNNARRLATSQFIIELFRRIIFRNENNGEIFYPGNDYNKIYEAYITGEADMPTGWNITQNIAQNTMLRSRKNQKEDFIKNGWFEYNGDDKYVLFENARRAIGEDLPVFQKSPDYISRDKINPIGNLYNGKGVDYGLKHAGSYPTTIYIDASGNLYMLQQDINNYGDYGVDGTKYDNGLQVAAKLFDKIGSPTIVRSGIRPITDENALIQSMNEAYANDKIKHQVINLLNNPNTPDRIKKAFNNLNENNTMKKFGGKLRYGWGGMDRQSYALNALQKGYSESLGTGHSVDYWINEKGYNKDYMLIQNPAPIIGYMPSMGINPDGSTYTYQQPIYGPATYSGVDDLSTSDYYNHKNQGYDDIQYLTNQGKQYFIKQENAALDILNSMKTRISNDISQQRNLTAQQIARFGGLIGVRRKYPYGGNYIENNIPAYSGYIGWGTEVKPEDIAYSDYEAKGEGIVGSEIANKASMISGIGAGIGTMAGTAAGTALGAWGGPIGMAAGALLGTLIGVFTGRKKRREEEARRRELLAEQKETNRQNIINNMNNRYENDVAKIRTATQPTTFSGQSFYMKHGGIIKPRMKYNNGGTILPNSSDTAVAFGRTHEQVDPMTGETGITYGNAEVEGGGLVGNKELPGEVIQQTPNGDRIYSDSLYVPGTRATYAQIAKALTDKKGIIEQEISTLQETLDTSLDTFNKAKLAKAKTGTATRNIEKLAAKLNLKTGELAQVDAQLNDVFTSQEQMATILGLRDIAPVTARFGGYRPKYKFGVAELGLGMNTLSFIGNMIGTGLSAKNNLAQLDFISRLPVPKTNKVEAEYYTIDTSPYEEASRKMAAETRRFNKWIEDNVSNPQVLRNQKRKNLISYYEGLSDINAKKSAYLSSRYDLSRNARVAAINTNNQGEYQDALNEYNKNMQITNARMSVNNQTTQNYMASINQLMQAIGSYGNQKMYLAQLPRGVQNEFYFGKPRAATTSTIATSKLYNDYLVNRYGQSLDIPNPFNTPRLLFNPYALG